MFPTIPCPVTYFIDFSHNFPDCSKSNPVISQIPKVHPYLKRHFVIGDLHGNSLKLVSFVLSIGACTLPQDQYDRFIDFYYLHDRRFPLNGGAFDLGIMNENNFELNFTLNPDFNSVIILLGDVLCDRGKSDYLTLYVLQKLFLIKLKLKIILGNHDVLALLAFDGNPAWMPLEINQEWLKTGQASRAPAYSFLNSLIHNPPWNNPDTGWNFWLRASFLNNMLTFASRDFSMCEPNKQNPNLLLCLPLPTQNPAFQDFYVRYKSYMLDFLDHSQFLMLLNIPSEVSDLYASLQWNAEKLSHILLTHAPFSGTQAQHLPLFAKLLFDACHAVRNLDPQILVRPNIRFLPEFTVEQIINYDQIALNDFSRCFSTLYKFYWMEKNIITAPQVPQEVKDFFHFLSGVPKDKDDESIFSTFYDRELTTPYGLKNGISCHGHIHNALNMNLLQNGFLSLDNSLCGAAPATVLAHLVHHSIRVIPINVNLDTSVPKTRFEFHPTEFLAFTGEHFCFGFPFSPRIKNRNFPEFHLLSGLMRQKAEEEQKDPTFWAMTVGVFDTRSL